MSARPCDRLYSLPDTMDSDMTDTTAIMARQREIASEHLLFKLMEYVEAQHPGLLDFMEASLDHLGDPATDDTKDDAGVRQIAARMITGARKQGVDAG